MARVVVGVDSSPHSLEALEIAAHEARWRSATLEVVHVFRPRGAQDSDALRATATAGRFAAASTLDASVAQDAFQETADQIREAKKEVEVRLQRLVAEIGDAIRGLPVEYTVVIDQHPAEALVNLAENADLLVVGSRGLGGFKGVLLGSVSLQCVLNAAVPVLVVRPRLHGTPVQ